MSTIEWHDVGDAAALAQSAVQVVYLRKTPVALSFRDGVFGAVSSVCNHAGGPLGKGTLDGDYLVCPWHQWKFHRVEGQGERGYEEDAVPAYDVRVNAGRVEICTQARTPRSRKPHAPHPLSRAIARAPGRARVVGLSTTSMQQDHPRFSTSEALIESALEHAASVGLETQMIRLRDLSFKHCEGFYSKAAKACTWPCSITQMDPDDELDRVYEALVHWGDVFIIGTPIRWGAPSSLYFKMVERMNCIQNQVTLTGRVLLQNKIVGAVITGGQDNVQAVAGQMLGFFGELGCQFPQFPYIAHSRGWTAEDMERNVEIVRASDALRTASHDLVSRCVDLAERLIATTPTPLSREGRKGRALPVL
ncbi:MAG: NAD(P)H-dependent oxidoreductase [Deltaproteobacteria bacterium]|nr:NAD(P)H-dependent oxidoreductase [Deltaproteobacteria bacterium]